MKMYILTTIEVKGNKPGQTQEYLITHDEFVKLQLRTDLKCKVDRKMKRTNFYSSKKEMIYTVIEANLITSEELL